MTNPSPESPATTPTSRGPALLAPSDDPLPDPTGWNTHPLAVAEAADGAVWVGTYGLGIYVSRDGSGRDWENLTSQDSAGISWDFVNAIAFAPDGAVWYGTVGNGWGVSRDGGKTWRNWTFDQLGPMWQYVVPDGIAVVGDTVFVATADGLRITTDGGETYRDVTDANGLPNKYLLDLVVEPQSEGPPRVRVRHLRGVSASSDGGRTWVNESGFASGAAAAAEQLAPPPPSRSPLVEAIRAWRDTFRDYPDPGLTPNEPGERDHFWFRRPINPEDDPYLDQTYTYGSTMGGNFQQHQGVEFNNPEGTLVHAIGDGVVAFAGQAEAGANTVAILHDRRLDEAYVWSTYYHNSELLVEAGQRVRAGDRIARVGSTGRATNDHLHLEIHVTSTPDSVAVVDPANRFPLYTRNPQLWIEPLAGTGTIAGRVLDSAGQPVPGARVYGVTKPLPRETPFSFAETYEDKAHPDPVLGENFAIGDVPEGTYVLGVEIQGSRVWRSVRVVPGKVTEVEFRP
ncbi:MAG: peptidoglycan DD-metalloendopeptidase family protein [Gemmatimonadota bacterium]